ncbi:hypothetical protein ABEB36_015199 [Hypothenemus hampei]|uniref:Regulatory protein zeste n=1 Tax=Hypothenemus hampei TaxID=57062 RepID=A0ABD1E0S0_HYPHA
MPESKAIIENKATDAFTWHQKEEAWKDVAQKFNASSIIKRSVASIKNFYENQKRSCHKKAAEDKRCLTGTGSGPSLSSITKDSLHDLTLSIVNKKTVYGLKCQYGWDSANIATNEEEILQEDNSILEDKDNEVISETFIDWENGTPMQLMNPLNQKLQAAQKKKSESKRVVNSSRRGSTTTATESVAQSYKELSKVKKYLAELQIEIYKQLGKNLKEVEEELKVQRKRHSELHALEIEIKRAQLASLQKKINNFCFELT